MKLALHLPASLKTKLENWRAKGSTATQRIRSLLKRESGKPPEKGKHAA